MSPSIKAKDRPEHPCLKCGEMTRQATYCKKCHRELSNPTFMTKKKWTQIHANSLKEAGFSVR